MLDDKNVKMYLSSNLWAPGSGKGSRGGGHESDGHGVGKTLRTQMPHFYSHVGCHVCLSPVCVRHQEVQLIPVFGDLPFYYKYPCMESTPTLMTDCKLYTGVGCVHAINTMSDQDENNSL